MRVSAKLVMSVYSSPREMRRDATDVFKMHTFGMGESPFTTTRREVVGQKQSRTAASRAVCQVRWKSTDVVSGAPRSATATKSPSRQAAIRQHLPPPYLPSPTSPPPAVGPSTSSTPSHAASSPPVTSPSSGTASWHQLRHRIPPSAPLSRFTLRVGVGSAWVSAT